MYLYAPYSLLTCDGRGLIATPMYREVAYEEKKCLNRNLLLISSLSSQIWRRQGAYLYEYMDYTVRESLDTSFLASFITDAPLFFILSAETGEGKGTFKMT
jgi:hypothetical protein